MAHRRDHEEGFGGGGYDWSSNAPGGFSDPGNQLFDTSSAPSWLTDQTVAGQAPGQAGNTMPSWLKWLIQIGLGGIGAYASKRDADRARSDADRDREAALKELSPEEVGKMIKMLQGQYMQTLMPAMMNAQSRVKTGGSASGLTGSGAMAQLQAGIPAQFNLASLSKAISGGTLLSGQRANVYSNPRPPQGNFTSNFVDSLGSVVSNQRR